MLGSERVDRYIYIYAMVKSRYIGDGHPTFNRNPCNWYIKPYYWDDDHPLLYGNNGSLGPIAHINIPTKPQRGPQTPGTPNPKPRPSRKACSIASGPPRAATTWKDSFVVVMV